MARVRIAAAAKPGLLRSVRREKRTLRAISSRNESVFMRYTSSVTYVMLPTLRAGRRLGVWQIHAAPDVFLRLHLEVKLEFFIDTLAQLPPPEQGGDSRSQGTELRHVAPPYRAYRVPPRTRAMNAAICSQFSASS